MIDKIKYIFLDFSDNFKNAFFSTLKRAIIFLIVGIVASFFGESSPVAGLIGIFGIIIFGVFWASGIASTLINLSMLPKNGMIKYLLFVFVFVFSMILGYAYFIWGLCKLIIIAVRKAKNNTNHGRDNYEQ